MSHTGHRPGPSRSRLACIPNPFYPRTVGLNNCALTKALHDRLLWGRLLVALPPFNNLFFRAKHLFIAAINGNGLGGLSRAVARLSGLIAGQLEHSDHARPHERLQSLWPEMLFDGGAIKPLP